MGRKGLGSLNVISVWVGLGRTLKSGWLDNSVCNRRSNRIHRTRRPVLNMLDIRGPVGQGMEGAREAIQDPWGVDQAPY